MGPSRLHRTAPVRQESYFEAPEAALEALVAALEQVHAVYQAALLFFVLHFLLLILLLLLIVLFFSLLGPHPRCAGSAFACATSSFRLLLVLLILILLI